MKNRIGNLHMLVLPTALTLAVLSLFAFRLVHYEARHPVYVLGDNWDITYNGETGRGKRLADLQEILPPFLYKGDVIRIERTLDMEELPSPTLALIISHLAIEVFLDDELIAAPGMEPFKAGKFVGGNRYYLNIPADYTGKRLAINYHVAENHSYPHIYSLRFGTFHDLTWQFLNEYGYVLVAGVYLCLFGAFFLIFSLLFSVLLPEVRGQRISSVLCILFGIWILTHYRVYALFTGSRYTMTVEYVVFYLSLPLLYLLVLQVCQESRLFRIFALLNTVLVAVSFVLHFTGICHMHRFRNIFFVMCSFFLALLIRSDIAALREKKRDPVLLLQLGGPTIFCVMIFSAMLVYFLSGGDRTEYTDFSVVLLTTGPLVFSMTRFVIYLRLLMEMTPHKLEFRSLNTLAYIDALTGLFNRTLMVELGEKLGASGQDYGLVSMDLNGLKLVNDTSGHAAGDRLLKDFARVLREVFPEEAYLMRIGGDEFVVIWERVGEEHLKRCLRELEQSFSGLDAESGIPHSVACGYAFYHEFKEPADIHEVFLEADRRMYEKKHASGSYKEQGEQRKAAT